MLTSNHTQIVSRGTFISIQAHIIKDINLETLFNTNNPSSAYRSPRASSCTVKTYRLGGTLTFSKLALQK